MDSKELACLLITLAWALFIVWGQFGDED